MSDTKNIRKYFSKMKFAFFYIFLTGFIACTQTKTTTKPASFSGNKQKEIKSGINAAIIKAMDSAVTNGIYPNIHSILISRGNKLLFEKYYHGKDEYWGRDLGIIRHAKDSLHDIRSISKSIVSACVGLAIEQGKIKNVNQRVFDFFPEFKRLDTGIISLLTVKHLLVMNSGLVWNEDLPYTDPQNSEIRMTRSGNPVEFVLSQPLEYPPGIQWKYNGGTTQLLASIIEKTTGKMIDEFANTYLFKPLGITKYDWVKFPGTQLPAAASGLRLTSEALLKFGLMYANNGLYNQKQIIPAQWVKESMQSHIVRPNTNGKGAYGYQLWILSDTVAGRPVHLVMGAGNGNQRIFIDKEHDLVAVITAGNYNKWNIKNNSNAVLKDFIYPAIFKNNK